MSEETGGVKTKKLHFKINRIAAIILVGLLLSFFCISTSVNAGILRTIVDNVKNKIETVKHNITETNFSLFNRKLPSKINTIKARLTPLSKKRLEQYTGNIKKLTTTFIGKDKSNNKTSLCEETIKINNSKPLFPSKILKVCKDTDDKPSILHGRICLPTKDESQMLCTIGGPNCPNPTGIFDKKCTPTEGGKVCTYDIIPTNCGRCNDSSEYEDNTKKRTNNTCMLASWKSNRLSSESQTDTYSTNKKPKAEFKYAPENPKPNTKVHFDARKSDPGDENEYIVQIAWDLNGDGEWDSTDITPVHKYKHEGVYPVTLAIANNNNETDYITQNITIQKHNSPQHHQGMHLFHLPSVYEAELIELYVYTNVTQHKEEIHGDPVSNAIVEFNDTLKQTNGEGLALFMAPRIHKNTVTLSVTATKNQHSISDNITIQQSPISVETPPAVTENHKFTIKVSYKGEPTYALVYLSQTSVYDLLLEENNNYTETNSNGILTITPPEVNEDTSYNLTVIVYHQNSLLHRIYPLVVQNKIETATQPQSFFTYFIASAITIALITVILIAWSKRKK